MIIANTINRTQENIQSNLGVLLRVLALPIGLSLLLSYLTTFLAASYGLFLVTSLIFYYLQIIVAINVHRICILGADSVSSLGIGVPQNRELKFFAYCVVFVSVIIVSSIVLQVLSAIPYLTIGVIILFACFLVVRFSLIFPAVATDDTLTLKDAFRVSSRYMGSLFVLLILTPFVIGYIFSFIQEMTQIYILFDILSYILNMIFISLLSNAYIVIKTIETSQSAPLSERVL